MTLQKFHLRVLFISANEYDAINKFLLLGIGVLGRFQSAIT